MPKKLALLFVFLLVFLVGCKKRVSVELEGARNVCITGLPFDIEINKRFFFVKKETGSGLGNIHNVIEGGNSFYLRSHDHKEDIYVWHGHKTTNMYWTNQINAPEYSIVYLEGVKFWHKKERIPYKYGDFYYRVAWAYLKGNDRIFLTYCVDKDYNPDVPPFVIKPKEGENVRLEL